MLSPEGQNPTPPVEQPAAENDAAASVPTFANEHVERAMNMLHEDAAVRAGQVRKELEVLHQRGVIDTVREESVIVRAILKRVHRGNKASGIIARL